MTANSLKVEDHYKLVVSTAKKYVKNPTDLDDCIQEGCIGLIKATQKFNPDLGFKFSTYAVFWITRYIKCYMNKTHGYSLSEKDWKTAWSIADLQRQGLSPKEIALALGMPAKKVFGLAGTHQPCLSLDMPYGSDDYEDCSLSDFIEDNSYSMPSEAKGRVKELLASLDVRSRLIITLRYGLGDEEECTLVEIGKRLKLTPERIRQIERVALATMRQSATPAETKAKAA